MTKPHTTDLKEGNKMFKLSPCVGVRTWRNPWSWRYRQLCIACCGCREPVSGSEEEQQTLSPAEPALQLSSSLERTWWERRTDPTSCDLRTVCDRLTPWPLDLWQSSEAVSKSWQPIRGRANPVISRWLESEEREKKKEGKWERRRRISFSQRKGLCGVKFLR